MKNYLPKRRKTIKLAAVLIFFIQFHFINAYAQTAVRLSINEKDVTIETVLNKIESQSEYRFVYSKNIVDVDRKISIYAEKKTIREILDELFKKSRIHYTFRGDPIVLTPKYSLEKSTEKKIEPHGGEQAYEVNGKLVDYNNNPLPGVSVFVDGTRIGTESDVNGKFTLNVPENSNLRFSFLGYVTQVYHIDKPSDLQIRMKEDNKLLNEVVVVGYGTQRKADLSGAVDVVNSEALKNRPIVSIGQGLEGMAPNLNISIADGSTNTSPTLNIRGVTSINGGDPLVLVDNVPTTTGELARLNPNDIDNVSVLKDASSAAIYGARAAFGVILITTKSGKSDRVSVDVNANYSVRNIAEMPQIITDPYTVVTMKNQVGKPNYDPVFSDAMVALAKKHSENPSLSPYESYPADPTKWAYFGRTNWFEECYRTNSPSYMLNASVSQKKGKTSYYVSTQYTDRDGMFNYGNDKYKRYDMRAKLDMQITDKLKIGNNTSLGNTVYDEPSCGGNNLSDILYAIAHNHSLLVPKNPDGTWTTDPQGWLTGGRAFAYLEDGGRKNTESRDMTTTFNLDWSLVKGIWDIKADATFKRNSQLMKESIFPYTYRKGPDLELTTSGIIPAAQTASGFYNYNVYNIYTNVHKNIGKENVFDGILGFNQESNKTDDISAGRTTLISNDYPTVQLATGTMSMGESIEAWALRGAFFRLNDIFRDRYILELNGRYDGTSRFPKKDRFGFFPSASAAYVLSREKFMEPVDRSIKLDNLKLRVSYGSLGNQNVSAYSYIPSMSAYQSGMILDGSYPISISSPGLVSNSLTWEKVRTANAGIDLLFLGSRLNASFDTYVRHTDGMLTKSATLPNVLGVTEPQENAANLKTQGWELTVGWHDHFRWCGSDFHYGIDANIADSKTFITKFANKNVWYGQTYYQGMQVGEIWGLVTEGFFKSDEEVKEHADQSEVGSWNSSYQFSAGDLKFKDLNNDGKITYGNGTVQNSGDFKVIGNSSPHFPFGINMNAGWKGFDVRAFFQGIGKRDWYPTPDNQLFWGIFANPWANVLKENMDYWTPEHQNSYFPRLKSYIARNAYQEMACPQTKYLQNASYIRLQNLTFSYIIPSHLTEKFYVRSMQIYFSAENLFELDHLHTHMDVSTLTNNANEEAIYPLQRTYSFGVDLNF